MSRRRITRSEAAAEADRRQRIDERRDDIQRDRIEMVADRLFRPMGWASRTSYTLGFQGLPIRVQEHAIAVATRPPSAPPLRLAFASDFHAGPTTDERVFRAACDSLNALSPDVILLGGDFISVRANDIEQLESYLTELRAPLGTFGVWGNHDLRANLPVISEAMSDAGVRMLMNESVRLPAPHGDVVIVGLDDPILGTPRGELLDEPSGTRVLLMHAPDGLFSVGARHFDVAFCGHTHGGQIVLPGGVKPYLPHGKLSRTYAAGPYTLGPGNRTLIVSRGVGCSTLPARMNCRSEIHLVTITAG